MNDNKAVAASDPHAIEPIEEEINPATHLQQFLTDHNYELSVDALSDKNPYLEGKGFVLTDKPLLVISIKKKENK